MDPDIAWEKFSQGSDKTVEEVNKGMASVQGKLDTLLQLANESNINSARTAEIVPQVMGDTGAMEAQAAEMAATGGMPPGAPPAGMPGEEMPPDIGGPAPEGAPPEDMPMPEDAAGGDVPGGDMPPEGAPEEEPAPPMGNPEENTPMPPVDAAPEGAGGPAPMEGEMGEPVGGGMPTEDAGVPFEEYDWTSYPIDEAYSDFESALVEEAKTALDSGDTARVAAITQVMDAFRTIWSQSGVADTAAAAPGPEMPPIEETAGGIDGIPPQEMMKSEGDDMTEAEKTAETEPVTEAPVEDVAKSGEEMAATEEVVEDTEKALSEEFLKEHPYLKDIKDVATVKNYSEERKKQKEREARGEKIHDPDDDEENTEKSEDLGEGATEAPIEDVAESCAKSEPVERELPSFRDMMAARSGQGNPHDCTADAEMLRGVRLGNIYKSEKGTIIVQNSSKPSVLSSVGIQTKPDINNLQKSMPMGLAPEGEANEADPLRKSLKNDWETYIAYKQPETF